jgi:hypothetical protein
MLAISGPAGRMRAMRVKLVSKRVYEGRGADMPRRSADWRRWNRFLRLERLRKHHAVASGSCAPLRHGPGRHGATILLRQP